MKTPPDPIRINNKSYMFDKLSDDAQLCVMQLVDIDEQLNHLKFKMDQLQSARGVYVARLNVAMKESENASDQQASQIDSEEGRVQAN